MMRYIVEIYHPDKVYDVLHMIESEAPFMAITPGSTLDQRMWGMDSDLTAEGRFLRVKAVNHILTEEMHKLLVFTKAAAHTPEEAGRDCSPV